MAARMRNGRRLQVGLVRVFIFAAVLVALLPAASGRAASAAQVATATALSISPPGSGRVGQPVGFDVTVSAADGSTPAGVVAIQTGGECGSNSPLIVGALGANGSVSFTQTFAVAFGYRFQACFFPDDRAGYAVSGSGYQDYPITRTATATVLSISPPGSGRLGPQITI